MDENPLKDFEKLDLSKKYPGYINKWIFRSVFILFVLIMLFGLHQNEYNLWASKFTCLNESTQCQNPYYLCPEDEVFTCQQLIEDNNIMIPYLKKHNLTTQKYVAPGESIGSDAPFIWRHGLSILFLLIIFAFALNHIVYLAKRVK